MSRCVCKNWQWTRMILTPKALACYGMLEAESGRMHLRFVSGRPVSQVTIDFLEGLCEQVQAQGKRVLVLIWDNASQAG